jgi:hypothetical protein
MSLKTYQQNLIDQRMDKYSKMGEYKKNLLGLKNPSRYKRDGFFLL